MHLPSTRSLEAMIAVAQLGSLAAASVELGMSVPALSRRIAQLERALGVQLFERLPRGVVLTPAGEDYHARVVPALDTLRRASSDLRRDGHDVVRLTTIRTFATGWLLPRLPKFSLSHPGIEVDVRTSTAFENLEARDIDLAVRLAPDGGAEPLLPIHLLPVWSPDHFSEFGGPAALDSQTLLGPDHRPEFWIEWLHANGLDLVAARVRDVDAMLLYEFAMRGAGVAIGIEPLVAPLLEQGLLKGLIGHRVRSGRSFHLVTRHARPPRAVQLFRDWLGREAEASARALQ